MKKKYFDISTQDILNKFFILGCKHILFTLSISILVGYITVSLSVIETVRGIPVTSTFSYFSVTKPLLPFHRPVDF